MSYLDEKGVNKLWTKCKAKFATKTEVDNKYLPLSGGTLTGNLSGKYITGTWLQTTAAGKASANTGKVCVLDNAGWIYYRTPAEIVSDGGGITDAYTKTEVDSKLNTKANASDVYTATTIDAKLNLKADSSDVYTRTQINTALNGKSDTNHTHESILDYGNTSKTIKIGYSGNGLTASQILYIAGYTAGADDNEHKIKDISKDVLKSWLGYSSEVTTGILGPNTNLPDITNSSYFWIVYPNSPSSSSVSFLAESSSYTGYQFAFIQGGTPGSIRYFKSTTTLSLVQTTSISFRSPMNYIKIKIG